MGQTKPGRQAAKDNPGGKKGYLFSSPPGGGGQLTPETDRILTTCPWNFASMSLRAL